MQGLRLGVPLFFVLSGLLLFLPWVRASSGDREPPDVKTYAIRRAARILPAYYLALAGAALVSLLTQVKGMPTAPEALAIAGMVQNWFPAAAQKLNPPAWTLAIEASFYVCLPLIGLATMKWLRTPMRQLAGCAGLVALSLIANLLITWYAPDAWHRTFPAAMYSFAFGMAIAVLLARGLRAGLVARLGLVATGTTLVILDAFAHEPLRLRGYMTWADVPAAAGFALLVFAIASAERSPLLSAPPVRWIGERSYGLYLWHAPIIFLLYDLGLLPSSTVVASVMVVSLAAAVAALSWRYVEMPILNRARRLSTRQAQRRRTGSSRSSASASRRPRVALASDGS
jgi:peptidoglycan/LPS O-acetylase OafA/YrhL